jgi:hypothetical protein
MMTSSDDSSVHSIALTEENQADLLDIGLFLLDDPDSANTVVSPVGVVAAAGVIAEGSSDEPIIDLKSLQPAWTMWQQWAGPPTRHPKKNPVIATKAQIFVDPEFSIKPAYHEAIDGWDVSIETGAITQENLDEWARINTANLIHQSGIKVTPEMKLVLQNAITFAAKWQEDFRQGDVIDYDFNRADGTITRVKMMCSVRHVPYTVSDGWRGVRLDYADGELAAFVLIPDDNIEQVTPTMLRQAVSRLCRPNETIGFVFTRLPRFTVATSKDLVDLFTAIGVEQGMDRAITTDLPTIPTQATQQAIIVVDEQGTVVSTVTILGMEMGIPHWAEEPIDIMADRPFYFIVGDVETGTPLFLSHIGDPKMA